jgi:4'-phosphopantetheinyl transferase
MIGTNIHIWKIGLDTPERVQRSLHAILAPAEKASADRMRNWEARNSFIVSRGVLRLLLARYTGTPVRDIRLRETVNGKPMLASSGTVQFNVSHSGVYSLLAFASDCLIGVDIEQIRALQDMEAVAMRYFCREEAQELIALRPEDRTQAFFRCWTRKEAFLKATGHGLSAPSDGFRVTLEPSCPACFLRLPAGSPHWSLYDINAAPDYAAALAHPGSERKLCVETISDLSAFL